MARTIRIQLRVMTIAAVAIVAAACSGSDSDGALPPVSIETTSSTTSTTVTTTTSTTTVTTASSDETAADRPELDPDNWETDLDELFGRYLLYNEAIETAFGPPEVDPEHAPLAELAGPEALADLKLNLQALKDLGQVFIINDSSLNDHGVRLPSPVSLAKTEGNEVVIQDCWIQDQTLETLDGEVVETYFIPTVVNVTMKVIDGEWRVFASVEASDDSAGWTECNEHFASLQN